jgi:hypothetical protein
MLVEAIALSRDRRESKAKWESDVNMMVEGKKGRIHSQTRQEVKRRK